MTDIKPLVLFGCAVFKMCATVNWGNSRGKAVRPTAVHWDEEQQMKHYLKHF
jgi:hypothetical protein